MKDKNGICCCKKAALEKIEKMQLGGSMVFNPQKKESDLLAPGRNKITNKTGIKVPGHRGIKNSNIDASLKAKTIGSGRNQWNLGSFIFSKFSNTPEEDIYRAPAPTTESMNPL